MLAQWLPYLKVEAAGRDEQILSPALWIYNPYNKSLKVRVTGLIYSKLKAEGRGRGAVWTWRGAWRLLRKAF